MTTGAVVLRHGTGFSRLRSMTGQARAIVDGLVLCQARMRIVARRAADAFIVAQETLAIRQPVRRKTHIDSPPLTRLDNELPRAMALAAEIRHVLGAHLAESRGQRSGLALRDGFHMSRRAGVTVLAIDARLKSIERQFALIHSSRAMAIEALDGFLAGDRAPQGLL